MTKQMFLGAALSIVACSSAQAKILTCIGFPASGSFQSVLVNGLEISAPPGAPMAFTNGTIRLTDTLTIVPLLPVADLTLEFSDGAGPDGQIVAFGEGGPVTSTVPDPSGSAVAQVVQDMKGIERLEISSVGGDVMGTEVYLTWACPTLEP